MALPLPAGLTHPEVSFLAEMELVTIVPRQRLDSIKLLSGTTPALKPPTRADVPLWLALLLKRQRRANIVPPPWLHPASLGGLIARETKTDPHAFSPPAPAAAAARADPMRPGRAAPPPPRAAWDPAAAAVVPLSAPFGPAACTAAAPTGFLPYHWLEVAEALLAHAGDDVAGAHGEVRGLLRDLVEVRAAKMRSSTGALEGFRGELMNLRGVGALELAESRGFVLGVVDGVRRIGASAEGARREEEEEEEEEQEERGEGGQGAGWGGSDDDMGI
ncbi:hypothetical protein P8C59_000818 [Phyllachora maydis]|uniref:DNA replication complex GINS protein PSF2 n=1 Tax=Phyllachora maydis TaxID=1825666 RepID=A0AAD9M9C5_9PEZI|nr:hypothetical protein P8C59_000818 [Phyllachora maydis]